MPDITVVRSQRTITTFVLDFPALRQQMPVAIDRDTREVYITPWFYPGGPAKCAQAAVFDGVPLLALDKGYLINAEFVRRHQKDGRKLKAIDMLIDCANRALDEDHNAEASPDPEGYVLAGPDKGKLVPIPGERVH